MTTQKYPDNCLIATYDARDVAAAAGLVRDTLDRFGQLDVLVNNAGRADGLQEGDPVRATEIIVSLAHSDEVPLRLPLGREAVERSAGDNRAADTFADCRLPRQRRDRRPGAARIARPSTSRHVAPSSGQ